jgi:hypothetical protein
MIRINIDKAKAIAHDVRRVKRTEEVAPLDVKATIPSEAAAAEAARQEIRERYADMQQQIDAAQSTDQLKAIIE